MNTSHDEVDSLNQNLEQISNKSSRNRRLLNNRDSNNSKFVIKNQIDHSVDNDELFEK